MAWRVIQMYKPYNLYSYYSSGVSRESLALHNPLVRRCEDWPDTTNILEQLPVFLGFSAAALVYGGLHTLAWFAHFDSSTEQLLWRISACVVMGGFPVFRVSITFGGYVRYWSGAIEDIAIFLGFLVFLAYILARAYLVVECFINLSHLPAEVYDVPSWSTYFPHIS